VRRRPIPLLILRFIDVDSSVWQVHLDAARTIIDSRDSDSQIRSPTKVSSFLLQQFFIADVFASTTTFADDDIEGTALDDTSDIFHQYLKAIQMITRLERQNFKQTQPEGIVMISPSDILEGFEQARARAYALSRQLKFPTLAERYSFNRIVNVFHHAGLIYAYRALFCSISSLSSSQKYVETESKISYFKGLLFEDINAIRLDKPDFAQDLVWPLFIAGTEAKEEHQQILVIKKLEQAMHRTGFSNCRHALSFLRAYWASQIETIPSSFEPFPSQESSDFSSGWITFAREWTKNGNKLLVF
jgi:Fungal specific transcription factor domain